MITQKLKNAVKSRIDAARGITKADVKQFAKDCIPTLLCLGVYMLPSAVGLANESVQITPLEKPLQTITAWHGRWAGSSRHSCAASRSPAAARSPWRQASL